MKATIAILAAAPVVMIGAPEDRSAPPDGDAQIGGINERDFANCRDRIQEVRGERGLPKLQQDTADPDEPLLIAAVDHRVNGCSALVMKHDTSDIRPLPKIDYENGGFIPAR